jgi:hypothetical protein
MDDIRSLLARAARRLSTNRFLFGVHVGLVGAAIVALLLVLLAKSSPSVTLPWMWILIGLGAAVLVSGLIATRLGRPKEMSLAVLVDERLSLKERLSTALAVRERTDPFAQAAVADAVSAARDPRTRETLARRFAVSAPKSSWLGLVIAGLAGLATLLPQGDLFASEDETNAIVQAKREADASVERVQKLIEKVETPEGDKLEAPALDNQNPPSEMTKTPEEAKRDAFKRLEEMKRKMEEVLKGEDAKKLEELQMKLSNLEPGEGEAKELGDAIKTGDFTKAKEALEKLKATMNGKTEAEKAEIESQMKNMADQLQQLSKNQEGLKKALEKAGLDGALANNPAALQKALDNAKGLTDAQKQQIQQAAAAQQAAAQQCQGLGQAMQKAAEQMCQGGQQGGQQGDKKGGNGQQGQNGQKGQNPGEGGQGGQGGDMQNMLSDLESMQQMLEGAAAAANAAAEEQRKQGQGMGQCNGNCAGNNDSDQWNWKNGWQGGRGRAAGGSGAQSAPTPTGTRQQKEKVAVGEGPIIAKQLIEGKTVAGESKLQADAAIGQINRSMESGVTEEQVPSHLADVHKHYFGELKRYVEAKARGENPPEPQAPKTDAAPASK